MISGLTTSVGRLFPQWWALRRTSRRWSWKREHCTPQQHLYPVTHSIGRWISGYGTLPMPQRAGAHVRPSVPVFRVRSYTAYFRDNDPREASATVFDSATNQSVKVGFPLPQAVWRTNHGYVNTQLECAAVATLLHAHCPRGPHCPVCFPPPLIDDILFGTLCCMAVTIRAS